MGNMSDWARNEVEIACRKEAPERKDGEFDYGCACYESALKAFLSLMEDGHSGMSFGFTRSILIRLMNDLPLTPIEDTPEVWKLIYTKEDGTEQYQCKRMGSLFKYVHPDGSVRYSANNYYCVDEDSGATYTGGGAQEILDKYVDPITMPYWPPNNKYEIHTREYLTNRANGDFDTKVYYYIKCPDGKRIEVNRFFKDAENGYEEISKAEFDARVCKHFERERTEVLE